MDGGTQRTVFVMSIQVVGSNIYFMHTHVCVFISHIFTTTQIITVDIYCAMTVL